MPLKRVLADADAPRVRRSLCLMALLLLVLAAPAGAAVTSTRLLSPGDPSFHLPDVGVDRDVDLRGVATVEGPRYPLPQVDVYCYANNSGVSGRELLATADVELDGSFSVTDFSLPSGASRMCSLRAVPHADEPGTADDERNPTGTRLARFAGSRVGVGEVDPVTLSERFGLPLLDPRFRDLSLTGLEHSGFDVTTQQPGGAWTLGSVAEDGVQRSKLYGGTMFHELDRSVFAGATTLQRLTQSGVPSVVVDGAIGYAAASAADFTGLAPGFEPLAVTQRSVDAQTGDVTYAESHGVRRCEDDDGDVESAGDFDLQPAPQVCHHLGTTGLRLERRYTTGRDGRQVRVSDRFTSVDGRPHALALRYTSTVPGTQPRYGFGTGPLSASGRYAQVTFGRSPASVIIDQDARLPDGHPDAAAGAVTFEQAPELLYHEGPARYVAEYERTVPAGGEITLTQTLSQASTIDGARALAAFAEVGDPPRGVPSTSLSEEEVIAPAPASARPDPAAFRVFAGSSRTCTVPRLVRRQARSALGAIVRAGCVVGRVTRRASRRLAPKRVLVQGVRKGSVVPGGTPVDLVVSRKPKPRRRR